MNSTDRIIRAGLALWREGGEAAVTARGIARNVDPPLTHAGVLYAWGSVDRMKHDIARAALAAGDPVIIRQLIVSGHAAVADMPSDVRQAWMQGV